MLVSDLQALPPAWVLMQHGALPPEAHFIAPERRATPGQVDVRADRYSAGLLLVEMTTGNLYSSAIPTTACWSNTCRRCGQRNPDGRAKRGGREGLRPAFARTGPGELPGVDARGALNDPVNRIQDVSAKPPRAGL